MPSATPGSFAERTKAISKPHTDPADLTIDNIEQPMEEDGGLMQAAEMVGDAADVIIEQMKAVFAKK